MVFFNFGFSGTMTYIYIIIFICMVYLLATYTTEVCGLFYTYVHQCLSFICLPRGDDFPFHKMHDSASVSVSRNMMITFYIIHT